MTQNFRDFPFGCDDSCHPHPKFKPVHVSETVKVAEIKDAMGNLRYKVALFNYETYIGLDYVVAYKIQVFNCFYAQGPLVIVTIPGEGEALLLDYEKALKIYHEYVEIYTRLVKAETRPMQDMDIYAEKVGYHHTCPKCCATCRWVRKRQTRNDYIYGISNKLECHNPKNCAELDFDLDCRAGRYEPGRWNEPKHWRPKKHHPLDLHPNVTAFGVCNNYETKKQQYVPMPGDSISRIIDRRIDYAVNNAVSSTISTDIRPIVDEEISAQLETTILPEVGKAIEHHLSVCPPIIEGNRNINDYNNDGTISEDEVLMYDGGGA